MKTDSGHKWLFLCPIDVLLSDSLKKIKEKLSSILIDIH